MNPPRLIDGTLAALWRHASEPLDEDAVAALTAVLPVREEGLGGLVPVVTPDAYGHEALQGAAQHAHVLEAVDRAALPSVLRLAHGRIVVHPDPTTLAELASAPHEPDLPLIELDPAVPPPTWEHRVVLHPHSAPELMEDLRLALHHHTDRVRLEDPNGVLDLDLATELARLPDAHRLTLAPTNKRGIATAIAHAVLAVPSGPAVVSVLLGRAPGGAPATEHLVDAGLLDSLRHAAETLALVTGRGIEPEHPQWATGTARATSARPRTGIDALDAWVHEHLDDWGITLTAAEQGRLMTTLRARVRPGDRLDGPTLWATLATVTDLPGRANAQDGAP